MKKFLFLFLLILIMSCGRETRYQIQLFIRNESNDNISIILFPSEKFHSDELYYKHTDYRSGNRPSEFILQPNEEKDIFSSLDMNQKPYELARKVLDSIHISTSIGVDIKFSLDSVIGYTENLFDSASIWSCEIRKYDQPTNFNITHIESTDYVFTIR